MLIAWSRESVKSSNIRHEAAIAQEQGKLVSVVLDALSAQELPLGLYTVQAGNLSRWAGADDAHRSCALPCVYLVRCADASLYVGWKGDAEALRRLGVNHSSPRFGE